MKTILSIIIFLLGVLWTIDNKPFTRCFAHSPYSNAGIKPFQEALDYIQNVEDENVGVFWSAPEATTKNDIFGVKLLTEKYLQHVEATDGHNGLAGLYGDGITAYYPGNTWDKLLLEYCQGSRKVKPVIIGELDYHGKGTRKINLFQTVIHAEKLDYNNIVDALKNGRSYAYCSNSDDEIKIDELSLRSGENVIWPGEAMQVNPSLPLELTIKGKVVSETRKARPGLLTVVMNGKKIVEKKPDFSDFEIKEKINLTEKALPIQYLRLYFNVPGDGMILVNPFIIKIKPVSITDH